ncbi:MAG: DJ-1/PfpI family protein [Campylobacterales bacterium]
MSVRVLVPLTHGFEEVEAVSMVDVMRRAGIDVVLAALETPLVVGANGITIKADAMLDEVMDEPFSMIALPGGHQGMMTLSSDPRVQSLLQKYAQAGRYVGAICASPVALEKAGVLGDRFTCYPGYQAEITGRDYLENEKVVVDGRVVTSRGPGTALCFGLEIVRLLVGEEVAAKLKDGMLISGC